MIGRFATGQGTTSANEHSLLARWREGDDAAGRTLYDRHAPAVARFFGNKAGAEREDLIQQTFEACLRSEHTPNPDTRLRVYLLGIARHKLYDHLFRRRGGKFEVDPMTTSVADVDPTPSAVVARHERDRQLAGCLRALPVDLQVILELHYWEDVSTAELAEIIGVPRGTVKTRLHRARRLLREHLERAPGLGDAPDESGLETWARSLRDSADFEST